MNYRSRFKNKNGAGNGTRTRDPKLGRLALYQLSYSRTQKWWRGKDSNLRRHRRQIYSLLPLATREPLLVSLHPIFLAIRSTINKFPARRDGATPIFAAGAGDRT